MEDYKILLHSASAGFEEKNDLCVTVSPMAPGAGIEINLSSPVLLQYGAHIKSLAIDTVTAAGYKDVLLELKDKSAWDYTIQARILAALERGMKND